MEIAQKSWYDKWYKLMLLPPVILFIICLIYLYSFNAKNGDFIYKDSTLSGGTTITLQANVDAVVLETYIKQTIPDVHIRTITDISTGNHLAVIIDSSGNCQLRCGLFQSRPDEK